MRSSSTRTSARRSSSSGSLRSASSVSALQRRHRGFRQRRRLAFFPDHAFDLLERLQVEPARARLGRERGEASREQRRRGRDAVRLEVTLLRRAPALGRVVEAAVREVDEHLLVVVVQAR
jgi:hypothetical protein